MCCPSRPSWLTVRTQMTLSCPMKPSWLTVHILFLSLVLTNQGADPWASLKHSLILLSSVMYSRFLCLALLPYTNGWYFWVMVELNSICLYPPILSRVSSYTYRHTHSQKPSHYLSQQLSDYEQILTEGNINITYTHTHTHTHIYIYMFFVKKTFSHVLCKKNIFTWFVHQFSWQLGRRMCFIFLFLKKDFGFNVGRF